MAVNPRQKADYNMRTKEVLEFVRGNGPVTVDDVATNSGITPQSAGTLMKTLRNRGLVDITGKRPTQGRPANVYEITNEGEDKISWMDDVENIKDNQGLDWKEAVVEWENRQP